jgi:hypothetical protein
MKVINDTYLENILSIIGENETTQMLKILHDIVVRLETSDHVT